jgi:hypothetical protein
VTEDELREALEKLRVEDVLIQTAATLIDLAARRLGLAGGDAPKDLEQAKRAIEGVRTLQPLLDEEQQKAVREPLSQLQMAYAREAQAGEPGPAPAGEDAPEAAKPDDEAERAEARAKIWTPPGSKPE